MTAGRGRGRPDGGWSPPAAEESLHQESDDGRPIGAGRRIDEPAPEPTTCTGPATDSGETLIDSVTHGSSVRLVGTRNCQLRSYRSFGTLLYSAAVQSANNANSAASLELTVSG